MVSAREIPSADDRLNEFKHFPVAWEPSEEQIKDANLTRFLKQHGLEDLAQLLKKSTEDLEWFYEAVLKALHIKWHHPYRQVVDLSKGMQWPRWFVGGKTNLVDNCLEKHIESGRGDHPALIWEGEPGDSCEWNYAKLSREVNRLAAGLKALGIDRGDRVGIFLPMLPQTAVALFACAKIGAVVIPIFSGYAADAVAKRLDDCKAKLLITADGFYRRGRIVSMKAVADQALQAVPSVEHQVVVKRAGQEVEWQEGRDIWYDELLKDHHTPVETASLASDEPFMIIYTSGTTGRPKGTVHTHAGFPIKNAIDMYFCFDVKASDRIFWLTDIGWMMGPWLFLGTTMHGATMVLYEGTPDYPHAERLWQLVEKHQVTVLGIAPTVIRAMMNHGDAWTTRYHLSSLRLLGSTGEPWTAKSWQWFLEKVGRGRCPIINYSGGTEVSGGILGCYPTLPLKPCSFHGPLPGIAADVVDEEGHSVVGSVGELVIRKPFVGMTQSFWQDDQRYLETYWSKWPDVWAHSDWAAVDDDGFWYILGRADDTIKVAGKRVGPSEIESAVSEHPAVSAAAAIGVPDEVKGEVPVLFVVLRSGYSPSEALEQELVGQVTSRLGKALKPHRICFVDDLPRTRNAKIQRRLIRAKYLGQPLGDTSALENPRSLEQIVPLIKDKVTD
ncbi:acetyl-CoA synthetase [Caldalkalibacillus thermarum]|uniref:AMP-binding protein n=1 Tax=Caldalkalibacillus thermarum TaxID=296745 RepID=UPI00166A616E|nr:AMP-binding protein [Caldalkalibacillus thermarum]GGK25401.1 acetyl-CoA synthetase [Caldalkalibacillus thermarum]